MAGRGSAPGERRGGRPKGGKNKRTVEMLDALKAAGLTKDTHPVVAMYNIYTGKTTMPVVVTKLVAGRKVQSVEEVSLDPSLRVKCMAEVAQYLQPKLRATELSGNPDEPLVTLIERIIIDPSKE